MIILNVAFPFAQVSSDAIGGAEQILSRIDVALTKAGHRSLVIACEGSKIHGQLIATPRVTGRITDLLRNFVHQRYRLTIANTIKREIPDVIHFHGVDCHRYFPDSKIPSVLTLHCPISFYDRCVFKVVHPGFFLHCVSASQRHSCPPGLPLLPDILNGVPEFPELPRTKSQYAMALGRICAEKNFHSAIDAAKLAKIAFILAGQTYRYAAHEDYFTREIRPRLDSKRRFIGPIGGTRKWRLLSAAQCLLVPSLVAETSSLVAMESLACGTPVIAFPSGALPEIIEHGRTGFIVHNLREMADAIRMAPQISPAACRQAARERFSAEKMTDDYIDLYRRLSQKGAIPSTRP